MRQAAVRLIFAVLILLLALPLSAAGAEDTANGHIAGQVIDKTSGEAVSGLHVVLLRAGKPLGAPARTDAQGVFTFANLSPGSYVVSAGDAAAFGGQYSRGFEIVQVGAGEVKEVVLQLTPKGRIIAEVRTPDGAAAAHADISIAQMVGGIRRSPVGTSTGPAGTVSITVDAGEYAITAGGSAYTTSASQIVMVTPGEAVSITFTVERVPTGLVGGRVLNSEGAPVTDGLVLLFDQRGRPLGTAVNIEADGSFAYEPLPPGTYQLTVGVPGYMPGGTAVTVDAHQTTTVDIILKRRVRIAVRVLGPDGRILPEAYLWAGDVQARAYTGAGGLLYLEAAEGDLVLAAQAPGYLRSAEQRVQVGAAGDAMTLTFRLSRVPLGTVKGFVVAQITGAAVADAHIELRMPGGVARAAQPVKSGPDGSFTLTDVPAGRYELYAWSGESKAGPVFVTVKRGGIAMPKLVMPQVGRLEIRVVDQAGKPVPYASVFTSAVGREQSQISTDGGGEAVQALAVGSYRVTARAGEHRVVEAQVVKVERGKTRVVVLTMVPAQTGTVAVRVMAGGSGVSDALVRLTLPADPDRVDELMRTDALGDVRFFEIPVGEYDVTLEGGGAPPVRIKVTAGETAEVVLEGEA
ncbi:MAG TPA: carboxypeptidase regulatory-like domain-containing protein [Symbiobacteriaceae bacterium]|nr:carboxypeptidase regulatory-like domain-containing protein [Symbiobacteriaceae bacterium]